MSDGRPNGTSRRRANGEATSHSKSEETQSQTSAHGLDSGPKTEEGKEVAKAVASTLVDFPLVLSLIFGGCCASVTSLTRFERGRKHNPADSYYRNVWSYEQILRLEPHVGTALTFAQMLFISLHSLPAFVVRPTGTYAPRLKPRQVPLSRWALQVLLFTFGSLCNNWAFAFRVPLTVQIVFRSAGEQRYALVGAVNVN